MIRLADFPQLRMLAWNRPADAEVDEAEADLLRRLVQEQGAGLLMDAHWADDIRLALRACETMPASHSN